MTDTQSRNASTPRVTRRNLLTKGGLLAGIGALLGAGKAAADKVEQVVEDDGAWADAMATYFQDHYQRMTPEEIEEAIARIERQAERDYGVEITCGNEPPLEHVVFGYALNISKCKGVRRCVEACVAENNLTRNPQMQYIRVLEMNKGSMEFEEANHYYDPDEVPRPGKFYLPVSCMHCENPPCVRACPTRATWREPDGIVVIDYNWCIGCHFCVVACPYEARHFNWETPVVPEDQFNTDTHYLGNRPRMRGVMEKCTWCVQRSRKGRLPACLEACPTGARVFGNLLDPASDIRYVLENKTVFRLKEDLNTQPKFWYYTD